MTSSRCSLESGVTGSCVGVGGLELHPLSSPAMASAARMPARFRTVGVLVNLRTLGIVAPSPHSTGSGCIPYHGGVVHRVASAPGPFHCPENRIPSFPRRRESGWVEGHVPFV